MGVIEVYFNLTSMPAPRCCLMMLLRATFAPGDAADSASGQTKARRKYRAWLIADYRVTSDFLKYTITN